MTRKKGNKVDKWEESDCNIEPWKDRKKDKETEDREIKVCKDRSRNVVIVLLDKNLLLFWLSDVQTCDWTQL